MLNAKQLSAIGWWWVGLVFRIYLSYSAVYNGVAIVEVTGCDACSAVCAESIVFCVMF